MKRLEDIRSWQLAREINLKIIELIKRETIHTDKYLSDQLIRTSASIADNIAEGFARNGNKEFIQFLSISKGSCVELKSHLYKASDRNLITKVEFDDLYDQVDHVEKMNSKLINSLKISKMKGSKFM